MNNTYKNNILLPTAYIQFCNTPSLFFKYKGNYDLFLEDNYRHNRNKWNSAPIYINILENKTDNISNSSNIEVDIVVDDAPIEEINKLIENNTNTYHKNDTIENEINNEIEVKKIKYKKNKVIKSNRSPSNTCPYCLSKLITNEFNILECSGDKIKVWEKTFIDYEKMNDIQKKEFIKNFDDVSMFNELYERWSYKDERGMRQGLTCIFTNKLHNPVSRIRTTLYDPILVKTIEKSLGRKLTDRELSGEEELWREKNSYFTDYKKNRRKIHIPELIFPDNFM